MMNTLLLVTELNYCNNPKATGKFLLGFFVEGTVMLTSRLLQTYKKSISTLYNRYETLDAN